MHANLHQPLSLAELAEEAFLTKWHFLRQFKVSTGQTPHAYMREIRIEEAKRRLAKGAGPTEVAGKCGFSSSWQFARTFRKAVGVAPSNYGPNVHQAGSASSATTTPAC